MVTQSKGSTTTLSANSNTLNSSIKLSGYLDSIDYTGNKHWSVIKIDVTSLNGSTEDSITGKITCTGTLPPSCRDVGCQLELQGAFEFNEKYNKKQFAFKKAKIISPASERGTLRFLEKELAGVGPILARQIYDRYGANSEKVIKDTPELLSQDIRGISPERAASIRLSFLSAEDNRILKQQLYSVNLTSYQINQLFVFFGRQDNLLEHLKDGNIYKLTKQHGFGFKKTDLIARKIGVTKDHPLRIRHCIFYVLEDLCGTHGHIGLKEVTVLKECQKLLEVHETNIDEHLQKLLKDNKLFTLDSYLEYVKNQEKKEHAET